MIDEIDYFPKRERHNKKKKVDSGWGELKKQKNKQEENPPDKPPLPKKNRMKKRGTSKNLSGLYIIFIHLINIYQFTTQSFQEFIYHVF